VSLHVSLMRLKMKKILLMLSVLGASLLLQSCSGSGVADYNAPANAASSSTGTVAIANAALQFSQSTNVVATFKNADGTPASGITVNFSTTLGTLNPSNGIAATDANGQATVQLVAGTVSGQGSVTATASISNKVISKSGTFTVQLPTLKLSAITVPSSPISYGASTSVQVSVLDANGVLYTAQDVFVTFTSTQAAANAATINSPIKTVNGVATTTYTAITNSGIDTVTASIAGSSQTAAITVNPLSTSAIQFISATPTQIGLQGVNNGLPELSKVIFKVIDSSGQPKPNVGVSFSLNTAVGGITLSGITNTSPTTGTGSTDSTGQVAVFVNSGTIATTVRVTATVTGTTISTQSDQLVIATGLPAQDAMSVSVSNMNSESWDIDGVPVTVTARLADHFKNPVNGVAVYFTTSGGSIDPYCITNSTGACSVTWRSQAPRPQGKIDPITNLVVNPDGPPRSGQATILAYAVGEEGFLDSNGNGVADGSCAAPIPDGTGLPPMRQCGEFQDWSEAFLDQNWDGVRNSFETFIDFNSDGVFNGPDGKFNGALQGAASVGSPRSKHIFINYYMVMSGSDAYFTFSGSLSMGRSTSELRTVTIGDVNGNTMPSGTTVSFTGTNGLTVSPSVAFVVPQNIGPAYDFNIGLSNSATTAGGGLINVVVTTPGGVQTLTTIPITW
jgi:hypothetical protein